MNVLRSRMGKLLLGVAGLAAATLIWILGMRWYWSSHPDAAFRATTGRTLPPGVHAIAYTHETSDNLFHTTHYWLLAGSPSSLRQITNGTGFGESIEEARA